MNKKQLIDSMSLKNNLTKKDNEKALTALIDTVGEVLQKDENVQIVNFGTWESRDMPESSGVSKLQEGQEKPWTKPAFKKPVFKAGKELREAVNK